MESSLQILQNVLSLMLLGVGYYFIEGLKPGLSKLMTMVGHGLIFGLIAFLVTSTPVSLNDGATVDARSAPVILAGLVGGPIAAVIAASLGGIARALVGGSFAISGVIVYLAYAMVGVGFWFFRQKTKTSFFDPQLIFFLCLASCAAASGMFLFIEPSARAWTWLLEDLPIIYAANCLGIVFASVMLGCATTILAKSDEIVEVNNTLRLAKRAGNFGVWDYDLATGILAWDNRSMELHGVAPESFTGNYRDWIRNLHPEDMAKAELAFSTAMKHHDSFEAEYRVIHDDGTEKTVRGDALLLRDAKGDVTRVVGTNLDLTEIRATQKQLQEAQLVAVQAQKFDTIGQLTGGVAHDFNNLLAVIMGNLELIDDEIKQNNPDKNELRTLLRASMEASQRGAELTQNMLSYARRARLDPVELDLNEVVRETEAWMRRTIPSKIEIKTKLQAELWLTLADRTSLQSALVNLLVNARDSFLGSGEIVIETENIVVDSANSEEQTEDIPPGRYVRLSVKDTGEGIDPSILASIFDPFFTTKKVGEGSGLGLSMVQGFVKQSGGAIRVQSESGLGTDFKLFFPALTTENELGANSVQSVDVATTKNSQGHRILLVEDREEVLLVFNKMLRRAGYQVVTATNGDAGYRLFCADTGFDLVITDVVMPGELQGPSMAKKIREVKPEMNFIFLSGYASENSAESGELRASDIRLMKPVSRETLTTAVKSALAHQAIESPKGKC